MPDKPSLAERVQAFQMLELPGQPRMMHMGTSYLVNDLWAEIKQQQADLATFGKDTTATENRIIDAEFKAQELRSALLPCVGWLEYAYNNIDSVTATAVKAHLPTIRAVLAHG